MQRRKLIIANWKMNFTIHEASLFVHHLVPKIRPHLDTEVVLAPSFLSLPALSHQVDHRTIKLAAQNFYWRDAGAYTGEVSATQLAGLVNYVLVGHSERRHIFGELESDIRAKVQAGVRNNLRIVLCVGETASQRAAGETHDILHDQIASGLRNVTSDDMAMIEIAYEPVWAIGTGDSALPRDAEAAAKTIRIQIKHLFGADVAAATRILYGGSVSLDNAVSYLETTGIDGLLIGGASLRLEEFAEICKRAHTPGKAQKRLTK